MNLKRVETVLYADLKYYGFKRKGRNKLYLKIGDVIGLFNAERPSGNFYLWFAIIPLITPCPGFIYLSYGNRLERMYDDVHFLDKESTEAEIEDYCEHVLEHIHGELLPLLEKLSTAQGLLEFSEKAQRPFGRRYMRQIFCRPEELRKLYMYSSLYVKDYPKALKAAKTYSRKIVKERYYVPSLIAAKKKASDDIITAINEERYDWIDDMFSKNIAENLALFEPKTEVGEMHTE